MKKEFKDFIIHGSYQKPSYAEAYKIKKKDLEQQSPTKKHLTSTTLPKHCTSENKIRDASKNNKTENDSNRTLYTSPAVVRISPEQKTKRLSQNNINSNINSICQSKPKKLSSNDVGIILNKEKSRQVQKLRTPEKEKLPSFQTFQKTDANIPITMVESSFSNFSQIKAPFKKGMFSYPKTIDDSKRPMISLSTNKVPKSSYESNLTSINLNPCLKTNESINNTLENSIHKHPSLEKFNILDERALSKHESLNEKLFAHLNDSHSSSVIFDKYKIEQPKLTVLQALKNNFNFNQKARSVDDGIKSDRKETDSIALAGLEKVSTNNNTSLLYTPLKIELAAKHQEMEYKHGKRQFTEGQFKNKKPHEKESRRMLIEMIK
jgi:hypothetical protein